MTNESALIKDLLNKYNATTQPEMPRFGMVLAAGHGKRIRSETSKMLHEIWGRPSVLRVAQAVQKGLDSINQIIVVGIKGADVIQAIGSQPGRIFAYQENPVLGLPAGTGDAVRVGLQTFSPTKTDRDIYIFVADMALLRENVVALFRQSFENSPCDMMMLTGMYSGSLETNTYGRIVRVPKTDDQGHPSGQDHDKVIEIIEHKDILSLNPDAPYEVLFNGRNYVFSQQALLETREINTGVMAFKEKHLRTHIQQLDTDNSQGELMLTDLVHIFNQKGLTVRATVAEREEEILAFNVKSVWRQMESIARRWAYERIKDTITIVDEEDFFIADNVIDQILALDKDHGPLDIVIGKGVHLGPQVQLNRKVHIGDRSHISGHVILGEDVYIGTSVELSTHPGQTLVLGNGVEVLTRNVLKGNLQIGDQSRIESGVILTGSDEHPMRIGQRVTIKGTSYLYGCLIDDDMLIEHSVIKCKRIEQARRRDGTIQPVRYVLPQPEGLDTLSDI